MINFSFDGKAYTAQEGDTLAAALLRNGIGLVGRSFKYHRPRGIMTAGVEEPNALVTVGTGVLDHDRWGCLRSPLLGGQMRANPLRLMCCAIKKGWLLPVKPPDGPSISIISGFLPKRTYWLIWWTCRDTAMPPSTEKLNTTGTAF